MDKVSKVMFKQVISALSHMTQLDAESEAMINSEIERIKAKVAPKKKDLVEDVENIEPN